MGDEEVSIIRPPDTLKSKVREGGPGSVDMEALERAEQVIVNLTDDYLEWVKDDLTKFQVALDTLVAAASKERKAAAESIFQISHDVKGQGGSFGYDLMTIVGNSLCRFIEMIGDEVTGTHIKVIKVHIDTMNLVIAQNIQGDGGAVGGKLLDGLEAVVGKHLK